MPDSTNGTSERADRNESSAAGRSPSDGARPPWRVEGSRQPEETKSARPPHKRVSVWGVLVLLLTINWLLLLLLAGSGGKARVTVPYSYFKQQVQAGNVANVNARGASIQGTFRHAITYPAQNGTTSTDFGTERPAFADDHLLGELTADGAVISAKPTSSGQPLWVTLVGGVLPTILLIWFWIWIIRRWSQNMKAGGGMFSMGQSKAHKYEASAQRTTFADVAGIDEATEELQEVVDFLKHPDRYRRLGGEIPRGVSAQRPARSRQDAPRQGGCRRGRRAVLLDIRLGVRRDDRRCRRQPRP